MATNYVEKGIINGKEINIIREENINYQYLTLEILEAYWSKASQLIEYFGKDILTKAINKIRFGSIVKIKTIPINWGGNNDMYYVSDQSHEESYVVRENKRDVIKYRQVYSIYETTTAFYVTIGDIVGKAFYLKYPWMQKFHNNLTFSLPTQENFEDYIIYFDVTMENIPTERSVYIYLKQFSKMDVMGILKAHINLQKTYYTWSNLWGKGVTEEDVLRWREETIMACTNDDFSEFLSYVYREKLIMEDNKN